MSKVINSIHRKAGRRTLFSVNISLSSTLISRIEWVYYRDYRINNNVKTLWIYLEGIWIFYVVYTDWKETLSLRVLYSIRYLSPLFRIKRTQFFKINEGTTILVIVWWTIDGPRTSTFPTTLVCIIFGPQRSHSPFL